MLAPDVIAAFAALFMVGMLWLRTGMHYPKGTRSVRALTSAGRLYFAAFGLLLVVGWFVAPPVARSLAGTTPLPPTLARVVWFLAAYYLFIPLHGMLRARGLPVFRSPSGTPTPPGGSGGQQ
jgi:hypothetical protein